ALPPWRAPLRARLARTPSEDDALEQRVAHHAVPSVGAARDLTTGEDALERRLRMLLDRETTALVVEDGERVDPLRQRVDPGATVAAEHVRKRDLGVLGLDARRVEPHRRAPVIGEDDTSRVYLIAAAL